VVDCAELRDALVRGQTLDTADVSAHTAACAACAELVSDGGSLGRQLAEGREWPSSGALEELFAGVNRTVEAEQGLAARLRSLPTELRIAIGLGAALLIAIGELLFRPRVDLNVYPLGELLFEVVVYGLVLGLATRMSLRPMQRRAPAQWVRILVMLLALAVPVLCACLAPAHGSHPASLEGTAGEFVPRALRCFGFGAMLGGLMIVLLRALDRGAHGAVGIVIVAASLAGLAANLALHLHCPITHPAHLFAGHVTVGFALVFAYACVAHVLAPRPRR